jgi:hypothetical protein
VESAHCSVCKSRDIHKKDALQNLDESSAIIVMDWAMKYLQVKYREKQSDWYGKRGTSWHISSVITKDTDNETVKVTSYVHAFDPCPQDCFAQ